jgi:hypothetical protein
MPTAVSLPSCLMDCYKALYPKLDFSRVAFYSGLPSLASLGGRTDSRWRRARLRLISACTSKTTSPAGRSPSGRKPSCSSRTDWFTSSRFRACGAAATSLARGWRTIRRSFSIARGDGASAPTRLRKRPTTSAMAHFPSGAAPTARFETSWKQRFPARSLATAAGSRGRSPTLSARRLTPRRCRPLVWSRQDVGRSWCSLLFWPASLIAGAFSIFGFSNLDGAIGAGVGTVIGGIVGGLIGAILGGPLGAVIGALLAPSSEP